MFAYSWAESDYEIEQATTLLWEDAACRDGSGSLTDLFFSDDIADIELAKAVCGTCALAAPCLQGALARREPAGVWGGHLFADGQVIAFKRKRGRPPKVAAAMPSEPVLHNDRDVQTPHCIEFAQQRLKTA